MSSDMTVDVFADTQYGQLALEKLAQRETWEEEQLLVASLTHAPDLVEAHAALAARYRAAHVAAERA